ncbi:E3 ubiquitin-protein ligase rnf168-like [Polyodon spathula]|uniref:E3 ubiquitin-protein ligase rnf168-like n=1 Tax=Polyodon spathula TaxID=7913 RepID=UPI001B7E46A3|nr:E3 ubiquitin-protein ligase rnf168-like [Polyodon spathula]
MPQVPPDKLSQADCICPVCLEIFLEPVTLPCDHTFCKPCFQQTVDKSSLCCPICRKRVSTWARLHGRNKTLVNKELWERVQEAFPVHCQHRLSGRDLDDATLNALIPLPQLCKPGELRQEYEDQKSKLEAEKRVLEEEERRASEEFIQQLLVEEDGRRAEEWKRAVEVQLENDERLAQVLSKEIDANQVSETQGPSREISRQISSGKNTSVGNTEKYLSLDSNRTPRSFVHPETSRSTSLSANKENISAALGRSVVIEDGILTLSPQEAGDFSEIPPEAAKKINASTSDKDRCVLVPTSTEESENSGLHPRHRSSQPDFRAGKTGDEDTCKRKNQREPDTQSKFKSKRLKVLPAEGDPHEGAELSVDGSHMQQLIELENEFFMKLQQEKKDRLLALQLQRQLNKEMKEVNRKKNSPDGYQLRTKLPEERASCRGQRNWSQSSARSSTVRGGVETTLPANRPSGSMLTAAPTPKEEAGSQKGVSNSSGSPTGLQIYGKQMTITTMLQNHVN